MNATTNSIEELFPGLEATLESRSGDINPWTLRDGRLYNSTEQRYLHDGISASDQQHEQTTLRSWLKHPECLQSADTGVLLHTLHAMADQFSNSTFTSLDDLNLAAIHDSADDLQTNWACRELIDFISTNKIHLNQHIKNHENGLLLIYGFTETNLIAEAIQAIQPTVAIIFERDLDLLAKRLDGTSGETLLNTSTYLKTRVLLITDDAISLACRRAKAAIESTSLFCQEKIFSIRFQDNSWYRDLEANFLSGDSMLRDLRYLGFFVDELHMLLNSSICLTQTPPRVINYSSIAPHDQHAVIVASGPSLGNCLETIQEHRARFHLFCCYSTIGALLKAGLKPDYHCNQERHHCHVPILEDPKLQAYAEQGMLLCTANNDPRMNALYQQVVAFFRSASCSSALYAEHGDDIINGEGPQVANLALYYALLLGYRSIHLIGVDLGSVQRNQPRSPDAISSSHRQLDLEHAGNKRALVYTDQSLLDSSEYMSWLINGELVPDPALIENLKVFNYSDGLLIKNTIPSDIAQLDHNLAKQAQPVQSLELIETLPVYERDLARCRLLAFDWKYKLSEYCRAVNELIDDALNHTSHDQFQQLSERQLNRFQDQVLPRLMAGTLSRIWFLILMVNERMPELDDSTQLAWKTTAQRILQESFASMRALLEEMIDYVEHLPSVEQHQLRSCRDL